MADGDKPLSDDYVLRRGYAASARLNLMHYLWREQAGYLLHPQITEKVDFNKSDFAVAELGTGTGIWLLDLARSLPKTVRLDGFDISLGQCPATGWLPDNVTMSELDSLAPLPPHLVRKYDIVHVRHFLLVVRNQDPSSMIRNIMQMLKPGGFVQWGEVDFQTLQFPTADPQGSSKAIQEFWQFMRASSQETGTTLSPRYVWPSKLDESFRAQNLTNVTMHRFGFAREYLPTDLDVACMTWEEIIHRVIGRIDEEKGKKARELLARAYEEGRMGGALQMDRVVAIGQNPL